jgi:alpha-N-arabinofuranosidase
MAAPISVVTFDRATREVSLFAVNRSQTEELQLRGQLGGFGHCSLIEHIALTHPDLKAVNTKKTRTP